eukprot:GHVU01192160.1.p1 GENE.GHVU01192160.1~~GHVU01192160.1.p1  ORF type:complete len:694 (-),score=76.10 GHVU01192160.1:1255-3336(-)
MNNDSGDSAPVEVMAVSSANAERTTYYTSELVTVQQTALQPLSHQIVLCPVVRCAATCRRADIERHFRNHHPQYKLEEQANLITSHFRPKRLRRDDEAVAAAAEFVGDVVASGVDLFVGEVPPPIPSEEATGRSVSDGPGAAGEQCGSDAASSVATGQQREAPTETEERSSANVLLRLWNWLARIEETLRKLPANVVAAIRSADEQRTQEAELAKLRGNSIEEVAENHKLELRVEAHELRCRPCCLHGTCYRTPHDVAITGIFSTLQPLRELKKSLLRHLKSPAHKTCVETEARVKAADAERRKEGLINGRLVYSIIKEGAAYSSYESRLLLFHCCGVRIGTLNHSRKFCAAFARALKAELQEMIAAWLDTPCDAIGGRKPSVALNADKATNGRRTGQICGAVVLAEGELRCIMLRNAVVELGDGTAPGLAKMVLSAAATILPDEEQRGRVAAAAFDGQYIVMGVAKHMRMRIGGTPQWVTCQWDPAHRLELVVTDCVEDRDGTDALYRDGTDALYSVGWLREVSTTVQGALSRFQYGQGFEELKHLAEEMEQTMRTPKKFCEMRFIPSALRVYRNVLTNYPMMVRSYRDTSTIPPGAKQKGTRLPRTQRNKVEEKAFRTLKELTEQEFVGRLLLVTDFYARLEKVSCRTLHVRRCVPVCATVLLCARGCMCTYMYVTTCLRVYVLTPGLGTN